MRKKILAGLLALVMLLSLVPVAAFAAEGEKASENGLIMSKRAQLQEDGTYTIDLEAYVTGTVKVETTGTAKPADIVLVLDMSGSMSDPIDSTAISYSNLDTTKGAIPGYYSYKNEWNGYSPIRYYNNGWQRTNFYNYNGWEALTNDSYVNTSRTSFYTTRLGALKDAVDSFLASVAEKNEGIDTSLQHRVSIVKFAGDEKTSTGNDGYDNANMGFQIYNNTQIVSGLTAVTSSNLAEVQSVAESLTSAGPTAADYAMNCAEAALANSSADRNKVVVFFTDGAPNHDKNFDGTVANAAVSEALGLKKDDITIYSIGVFSSEDASSSDVNNFMNAVSSNYPAATSYSVGDTAVHDYYMVADNASELEEIFGEISTSITGSSNVNLDANAVLKDIMNDGFSLEYANATAKVYDYDFSSSAFKTSSSAELTATVDKTNGTVSVTGFDYAKHFVPLGQSNDNTNGGKKVVVTITGVTATDAAITNQLIATNSELSGMYASTADTAPVEAFTQPQTILTSKAYVVDYAKPFAINPSDWNQADDYTMTTDMTGLDTTPTFKYGTFSNGVYNPTTMLWDGYDSFYAFGDGANNILSGADANEIGKLWAKVNVIPANNVYYEDTFKDTTAAEGTAGTVGIVYSNNVTVGTAGSNTETSNNSVMGWIDSMADDKTDSDGTATEMKFPESGATATATFSFTGTGVDVYSRTDLQSGIIVGSLFAGDKTVATKTLMVDTLAVSAGDGSYYNIPTLSFSDLEYGEYKVKLTVTRGKAVQMENGEPVVDENGDLVYSDTEKRSTYYLDGIRIYNPLGDVVTDDTVIDAYDPDKSMGTDVDTDSDGTVDATEPAEMIQSVFTEVREILDASDNRVVFIDVDEEGKVASSDYAVSDVNTTYGPKNEVYLAPGQSVVFAIDGYVSTDKYYVGLKSLTGSVIAAFSDEEGGVQATINHTTDLYYAVTPAADGKVIVKNNSAEGILSVTKLQAMIAGTAAEPAAFALRAVSDEEATTYATSFATFGLRDYEQPAVEEPEVPTEPEQPSGPETPSEPEQPSEPETPVEPETPEDPAEPEIPDIDVDIENPEPEEKPEQKPDHNEAMKKLVKNLFNKLFGWFGR